jgi:peptidoglycan/LPS O-acetylase OafA/YrhL
VAFLIIPFLIAAFLILYVQGEETARRFAWDIPSRLTSAVIGAGYLGGAYFFLRAGLGNAWHQVAAGWMPVAVYTLFMLAATLLHWDKFDPGHWPFQVWLALYLLTPGLLWFVWRRNQVTDTGLPDRGDREVPPSVRRTMAVVSGLILLAAVFLFVFPDFAIRIWPWTLTPLTARVVAGWQALLGAGGIALARAGRWSAWRIALQSIGFWQGLVVLAFFLHRSEFAAAGLMNWFVLYTVLGLAAIGALALRMRRGQVVRIEP